MFQQRFINSLLKSFASEVKCLSKPEIKYLPKPESKLLAKPEIRPVGSLRCMNQTLIYTPIKTQLLALKYSAVLLHQPRGFLVNDNYLTIVEAISEEWSKTEIQIAIDDYESVSAINEYLHKLSLTADQRQLLLGKFFQH